MRKLSFNLIAIITTAVMMQSCVKDTLKTTTTYFLPVYKAKTEVWESIKSAPPQPLKNTGKLFLYGKYIFINEVNKGIHIIDNSTPPSPKNISFISIPGNLDLAVKDNILYADLYNDMLVIDVADPGNAVLRKVINKVFPEKDYYNGFAPDSTKYITDWVKQEAEGEVRLDSTKVLSQPPVVFTSQINTTPSTAVQGVSGSTARFTILDDYLYTVGRNYLTAFNVTVAAEPVINNPVYLGWNIETIYPLKDKLFIGSQTGMFIYSITDPAKPTLLGNFSHACFNDPVIADERYAYVTLRARTDVSDCHTGVAAQRNELDIVNIQDIFQPSLVKIYDMTGPEGMSKDGDHLFICDGEAGLKIYNVANVQDIKKINVISNIKPFDVICRNGLAIVVAAEGIYQYDYTNISDIKLLSKIEISKL